ncbi:MAG: hypothetical protein EPN49_12615 [Rhodanobacter sp.]|nr:MAG: hypothetical protein EPN49_12615 [Rhodanobacter sp.]
MQGIRPTGTAPAISRCCWQLAPAALLEALPALGAVLYVPKQPRWPAYRPMPRGLLAEDAVLAPLLQTHWLLAASVVTSEGPREWVECVDRHGHLRARLYLLPDTDYLAWDMLLAGGKPVAVPMQAWWPRNGRSGSAQLLRFHVRRLAGLRVLGCETAMSVSALSRHLAERVAGVEALSWRPMPYG